jgi:uncharacterized protein YgiB involved in biofilm formation
MKRSKTIVLMFVAAGVLSACKQETKPNGLRHRRDAQGQVMHDAQGNPLYEDEEGQYYSYMGGHYYPFFTRANGFNTIPSTGITAPATSTGVSAGDITSRRVPVARGGFGGAGSARSSSSGGGFSFGG